MIKAVLDACVLYPAPLRDILLSISSVGCFEPIWSNKIQEEWTKSLLSNREDLTEGKLEKIVKTMDTYFVGSNFTGFEDLIENIELPDLDDRHVLALAVKSGASYIVTINLRDFPKDILDEYLIKAISPDDFICLLYKKEKLGFLIVEALSRLRGRLKNPQVNVENFLSMIKNQSLSKLENELQNKKNKL